MRLRGPVLLAGAVVALATPAPASARFPPPPPFAFQDATLSRVSHTVDVRIQAVDDLGVVVHVARKGRRIGRQEAMVRQGHTTISVHIGRRSLRKLRPGLFVTVGIYFGGIEPLKIRARLKKAPRGPVA
jgi:hypothetical protein